MSKFVIMSVVLMVTLAACGTETNGISRVTAVPVTPTVQEATVETTAQPPEPTASQTPQPTTRLEATVDAATQAVSNRSTGGSSFAFNTPTPSENLLEPGEARRIALATDTVLQPEIEERLTFDDSPVPIQFGEFYDGFSVRTGMILSDKLESLDGQTVVMEGYVAPPLKPRLDFFVLTRIQLAFCPFCSSDVEWPDDIALVYLPSPMVLSTENPVRVIGQMQVGTNIDAETGMVSIVRIYADEFNILD